MQSHFNDPMLEISFFYTLHYRKRESDTYIRDQPKNKITERKPCTKVMTKIMILNYREEVKNI